MRRIAVAAGLVLSLIVACSSSKDTNANGNDAGTTQPAPDKLVVSNAGGRVGTPDGALTLDIPAGALTAPTEIKVTSLSPPGTPTLDRKFRLEPEGTTFAVPVVLEYVFEEAELSESWRSYRPAFEVDGAMVPLDYVWLDYTTRAIYAETTHFSLYGMVDSARARKNPEPCDLCVPNDFNACCTENGGQAVGSTVCTCSVTGVTYDANSCRTYWAKVYRMHWGTLDCDRRKGNAGIDGFKCSLEWMECCRSAGGIGPLAGTAYGDGSCACDLGCGATYDSSGALASRQRFQACLAKIARQPKEPRCTDGPSTDGGAATPDGAVNPTPQCDVCPNGPPPSGSSCEGCPKGAKSCAGGPILGCTCDGKTWLCDGTEG